MNNELIRIQNGYSSCIGNCNAEWYAGVLVIDDVDNAFLSGSTGDYDNVRENCRNWQETIARIGRRVALAQQGEDIPVELGLAELICGPVCPTETVQTPTLAWTQRINGIWELKLYSQGRSITVFQSQSVLRNPQVASFADAPILAFEWDVDPEHGEIVLLDQNGMELFRSVGRNPRLAASSHGVILMTEQTSQDTISLLLQQVVNGKEVNRVEISGGDDYTFNADLACDPDSDTVAIVAESCPAFGMDCRVGLHRDLKAWLWKGGGTPAEISGEAGRLPIERRAYNYWSTENMPPIRPTVFFQNSKPVVTFRQFRHFVFKSFGWDICLCRYDGSVWSKPVRVSEHLTSPDTGYGVVSINGQYVGAFPCLDNQGIHTRSSNHRVEIVEFSRDHSLPLPEVPEDKQDTYFVTTGYKNLAPPPPPLEEPYRERTLVWGDLHQHTNYSKCVSAMDGCPDEMFRYARDVLGCRVFTFMDHSTHMSGPVNTWLSDQLEILAGDYGIPLFGSEPSARPGRDTNWYAYNRELYDRLRCILDSHETDRQKTYRQALEDLPSGSILALRHFHGGTLTDDELVQSFEPQLEVAMEAMQGRTNALMKREGKEPLFPNQFLNTGFKIGLIGGTDHYRGRGPNHFCLTGFWVKEISSKGVWEALRNRYTIAMSDAKIAMSATMNGQPMGGATAIDNGQEARIRLSASCGHGIIRATLIRDGKILPWTEVRENCATLDLVDKNPGIGRHWYIPTVEVETAYGKDNRGYGHTSPFFLMVRGK